MADVMEHVAYLAEEIGPRPAGTEEEQQAALYITESMQKEAGLSTVIEDFSGVSNTQAPRAICSGLTVVFGIVALVFPVVGLPAALIAIVSAALYVAEAFGRPVLSRLFARGVSQNVVARYEPGISPQTGNTRRRKIILVAHYDSGKACPGLNGPILGLLPILKWVVLGGFVATALLLLLGSTVFTGVSGAARIVLNVLIVIGMALSALPLVQLLLQKVSPYNNGANCNASGVAALMEVAERVGRGRTDMTEFEGNRAVVHGEAAAREAGVIPEGAQVTYQAHETPSEDDASPVERLLAAKAAVAALSGKPVSDFVSDEILHKTVNEEQQASEPSDAIEVITPQEVMQAASGVAAQQSAAAQVPPQPQQALEGSAMQPAAAEQVPAGQDAPAAPAGQEASTELQEEPVEDQSNLPAWFVSAQKKAKKTESGKPVQRSRYADALEAAVSESSTHFAEANNAVLSNAAQRMQAYSDGIVEVKAPESALLSTRDQAAGKTAAPQQPDPAPAAQNAAMPVASPAGDGAPLSDSSAQPVPAAAAPSAVSPILPDDLSVPSIEENNKVELPSFLADAPQAAQSAEPRKTERVAVLVDDLPATKQPAEASASADPDKTIQHAPVFVDTVTQGVGSTPPVQENRPHAAHPPITLPSIEDASQPAVQVETLKQRAPLADVGKAAPDAKERLSALPSITAGMLPVDRPQVKTAHNPSVADLRSSLPSLSGLIPQTQDDKQSDEPSAVSLTGAFAPVGATSSFAPVGDELIDDVDPDEIYVDDADDSDYQETYTESGAFAGPGYVEMPKSRVRRLFDRFRRKDKEEESSPQEWLDVDESFDARSVGAARGGWESFREEGETPRQSGAYADSYADEEFDELDDYGYEDDGGNGGKSGRPWYGGAFSRVRMGRVDMRSGKEGELPIDGEPTETPQPEAPEMQKIYQFRNPDISTEVWFVALGAELACHSGMRAFIEEHAQDLRGSIIVELEALGAGELCLIENEGGYRVAKASSRMRRYLRKASQATGESVGSADMLWKSSASSYAITNGVQAMHLAGMEGAKPAGFGAKDDSVSGVDAELLEQRVAYIMELLKTV